MINTSQRILLTSLFFIVLLLGGGYFWNTQTKKSNAQELTRAQIVQELTSVNEAQDKQLFDVQENSIREKLLQRQTELEKTIQEVISSDDTKDIEGLSSSKHQLDLLTELYAVTADPSLLPALFQISLDLREFDTALQYLEVLQGTAGVDVDIDVYQYLYALFNADEIDFASLARFKQVVDTYESSGLITSADKTFYYSLVTLSRGDLVQYELFMEQLKQTSYADRHAGYTQALVRHESFVDTPEWYLRGLLGINLFQQGWYRPVQHISRDILTQDDTYLLAYQLNAYTSVMLSDWSEAFKSLEYLKANDEPNKELYLYLGAIVLYNQERYNETILALKQLQEQKFNQDVLRYQYLSYEKLQDTKGMLESLRLLIRAGGLTVYDYYTMFDTLFFQENSQIPLEQIEDELTSLLTSCYEKIDEQYVYICLYGKAGMNLYIGDIPKAYQYLTHASQWFPDRNIYERLGDLAVQLDKTQEATKRYIKAITSTSVIDQQAGLREKITGLME